MTTAGEIVLGFVPLFGALLFALTWLIQILTRLENRITRIETMMSIRTHKDPEAEGAHATLG